jgi:hypothetical protein
MTRLHNEKLHTLFSSPGITGTIKLRRMTQAKYVAHVGKARNVHEISVRKHDEKRPLGRPTYGVEDLKIDVSMWPAF